MRGSGPCYVIPDLGCDTMETRVGGKGSRAGNNKRTNERPSLSEYEQLMNHGTRVRGAPIRQNNKDGGMALAGDNIMGQKGRIHSLAPQVPLAALRRVQ